MSSPPAWVWLPAEIAVETVRPGGAPQPFSFFAGDGYCEATAESPEPHEFDATLRWLTRRALRARSHAPG